MSVALIWIDRQPTLDDPARMAPTGPNARRFVLSALALGSVTLAAGGCAAWRQKPPAEPPAVTLQTAAFVGTPLSPHESPATQATTDAVTIDITWIAARAMPADALTPLDAQAAFATAPLAGGPVLVTGRQTSLARFGQDDAADQLLDRLHAPESAPATQIGHQVGYLQPGTTIRLRCAVNKTTGRQVTLSFNWSPVLPATAPAATEPATTQPSTEPAADGKVYVGLSGFGDTGPGVTETALIDGLSLSPGKRYALLVPCDFGDKKWTTLAAYIEVGRPPSETELADLLRRTPATLPEGPTTLPAEQVAIKQASLALQTSKDPRPPLLFLANTAGAELTTDALLVADQPTLEALRKSVLDHAKATAEPTAAELGWFLTKTMVKTLAAAAEKGALSPELSSVLVQHAGEVGRHPDALLDIVNNVGNPADMQAKLVGENYIALEDNSPSARVRAYDWLKAQGRAPADFDPLADAKTRRAAINKALDASGGSK